MAGDTALAPSRAFREDLLRITPPALLGSVCDTCGCRSFPPRNFCPECGAEAGLETVPLSTRGVIFTYTVIHQSPSGRPTPYVLAYVDLDDGVRVMSQIACAPDQAKIGLPVELILVPFHGTDDGTQVYAFAPVHAETEMAQ